MQLLSSLVVAVMCTLPLCRGRPNESQMSTSHISSFSNSVSAANGFQVSISQREQDGKCVSTLSIMGNGIHKVIPSSCQSHPPSVINFNRTLLVNGEYYTDTPSVLVRLQGDKCEKEVFQEDKGAFTSKVEQLDDKECDRVKEKVKNLKVQQGKWEDWFKKQQQYLEQQLQQMQQNLQNLQQQFFGGFLIGK